MHYNESVKRNKINSKGSTPASVGFEFTNLAPDGFETSRSGPSLVKLILHFSLFFYFSKSALI